MAFVVHRIVGLAYGLGRRDVAFLESDEYAEINAWAVFLELNDKRQKEMLDRFDLWKRTDVHHAKYHHGFNAPPDCRDCHVFKRREGRIRYRYYGFKTHPWTNARYELCVLVNHGQKNQEETDPAELRTVNRYKDRPDVAQAILTAFPDPGGGANVTLYVGRR